MASLFSKAGSFEARVMQYMPPLLLFAAGGAIASVGTGNPFSSVFFTGALAGGVVSGGHNFFKTIIDFDSWREKILSGNHIKISGFSAACHSFKKGILPGVLAGAVGVAAFQFAVQHDVHGEAPKPEVKKKVTPLTAVSLAASANDNKIITDPFKAASGAGQSVNSSQVEKPPVIIIYSKESDAYGDLDQLCKRREVRCIKDGAYILN